MSGAASRSLVLVDYQQRLLPSIDRAAQVLEQALALADIARDLGIAVVGTEQNPAGLGANEARVRERCDRTIAKMHFDACADGLLDALPGSGSPIDVVVAGCEAHVCLLQTALGLLGAGHRVQVVAAGCGSRRACDHALAMARLRDAGATIASLEMVAFEWLGSCEHERFKPILERLKTLPI